MEFWYKALQEVDHKWMFSQGEVDRKWAVLDLDELLPPVFEASKVVAFVYGDREGGHPTKDFVALDSRGSQSSSSAAYFG